MSEPIRKPMLHLARSANGYTATVTLCTKTINNTIDWAGLEQVQTDPSSLVGRRLCQGCVTRFHRIRDRRPEGSDAPKGNSGPSRLASGLDANLKDAVHG